MSGEKVLFWFASCFVEEKLIFDQLSAKYFFWLGEQPLVAAKKISAVWSACIGRSALLPLPLLLAVWKGKMRKMRKMTRTGAVIVAVVWWLSKIECVA